MSQILRELDSLAQVINILSQNIDDAWSKHLDRMRKLKEPVSLRAYEQKSPLNLYIGHGVLCVEEMTVSLVYHRPLGLRL